MKLFRKAKSRFYWFDFTVRGQRYRGSTGETKAVRATKVASIKLAQALEHGDLFSTKPTVLAEFSQRFQSWLDGARLEEKTRKYYRNGCRLLKATPIFGMRLTEITTEDAERLKLPGSAGNVNCALRTLRRMLHKAEEWKLIARAPKIKLMKEHGRDVRLDADAEEKLVQASLRCKWRGRTGELFRDVVALMRDTGMRNERELFQMQIENLDWKNRITADSVRGALPLAHSPCTMIKINGDYLDTRLKNTRGELERYDEQMDKLLDRVFDEYGLIVAGWSAEWDIALCAALQRCPSRRFATYWAQRGRAKLAATDLIPESYYYCSDCGRRCVFP